MKIENEGIAKAKKSKEKYVSVVLKNGDTQNNYWQGADIFWLRKRKLHIYSAAKEPTYFLKYIPIFSMHITTCWPFGISMKTGIKNLLEEDLKSK